MAKRLNWEKANSQAKTAAASEGEHATISGAPEMASIFGRKESLKKPSDTKKESAKRVLLSALSAVQNLKHLGRQQITQRRR